MCKKTQIKYKEPIFSCMLNHSSPTTSAQVLVSVGMDLPCCRYMENNAIGSIQEEHRDCFGKCTVLVGDPVTFLFTDAGL